MTGTGDAAHADDQRSTLPAALTELRLDHVAIAVADLDAGSAPWLALGLARHGPDEVVADQGVRVRAFVLGDALVEVLAPLGPGGAVARFLERRGPGLHHLALRVTDLRQELHRLEGLGAELIDRAPRAGRAGTLVAFVHPRWTGGTLVELVEVRPDGAASA